MLPEPRGRRHGLAGALGLLAGFAVAVFGAFWILDYFFLSSPPGTGGPAGQLFDFDPDTLQNALGNLAQIIAAVLGIAITVVSIVVQLAATRYTSRVADMFFRDRTNLAIMGFFVVACIDAVWVSLSVTKDYVPRATIIVTVMIVTGSLLLLIPYFAYVFAFLDPEKVIARIGDQTLENAVYDGDDGDDVPTRQAMTVASMEQLADIAVNALSQKDKVIASDAIDALKRVVVAYLPRKAALPPAWFHLGQRLRENPDFVAMARESVDSIEARKVWFEWKALRQFRTVYAESLKAMPEMAHVVAIETRYVGEAAISVRDHEVLALVVKFTNTYLRAALNARDVRTAYNVLNQYRQLAEHTLRSGLTDTTLEVGGYFKYYGQLGHAMGLGFVTETAAYDLCSLCEIAFDAGAECHNQLLRTFLDVDKEAESAAEEKALRGVRKAQAKLATYYLLKGAEAKAREIYQDMAMESPERLRSIREEMLSITSREFWEVIDRGTNFDYLDDARKDQLRRFFRWFPRLAQDEEPAGTRLTAPVKG